MSRASACFALLLSLVSTSAVAGCRPAVIFIPSSSSAEPVDHGDHVYERSATAKAVGCESRDVVIRDHVFGVWKSTWAARCNDQTYRCQATFGPRCRATDEPLPVAREHGEKTCGCPGNQ